jgi:conjugal transfer pilus assembly protein TrbC
MEREKKKNMRKINIILTVIILSMNASKIKASEFADVNSTTQAISHAQQKQSLESGLYVFVSFAMNDSSLKSYFIEAQHFGGKLILRGLIGNKGDRNRFLNTKERLEKARINVDINPVLFEQLDVKHVPVIAKVFDDGKIYKVGGHITIDKALEIIEQQRLENGLNS